MSSTWSNDIQSSPKKNKKAIQAALRSSLAHIRHSRIAPSAINAPAPNFHSSISRRRPFIRNKWYFTCQSWSSGREGRKGCLERCFGVTQTSKSKLPNMINFCVYVLAIITILIPMPPAHTRLRLLLLLLLQYPLSISEFFRIHHTWFFFH